MTGAEWIGWGCSALLLWTIAVQIRKQWRERTRRGVSNWLFAGQVGAEFGFVVYSLLVSNWIFAATNAALLVENAFGLALTMRLRKRENAKPR